MKDKRIKTINNWYKSKLIYNIKVYIRFNNFNLYFI